MWSSVGEIANSEHHGDSGSPQEGKDGDSVGEHLEGAADHHVHVQVAGDQLALKKKYLKNHFHVQVGRDEYDVLLEI